MCLNKKIVLILQLNSKLYIYIKYMFVLLIFVLKTENVVCLIHTKRVDKTCMLQLKETNRFIVE